jgi:hypothetical protein
LCLTDLSHGISIAKYPPVTKLFSLVLLAIAARLSATTSPFLLGLDYTEWAPANVAQVATDSSGNIYVLSGQLTKPAAVAKLTPDGGTLVWQVALGYSRRPFSFGRFPHNPAVPALSRDAR